VFLSVWMRRKLLSSHSPKKKVSKKVPKMRERF